MSKQISQLRNEKDMYIKKFPERVQLLKNMGFEWDVSALPDEWDLIRIGECYFENPLWRTRLSLRKARMHTLKCKFLSVWPPSTAEHVPNAD